MEDRITDYLYLEMIEGDAAGDDGYATRRVPNLLATEGVHRATWWTNVNRDRSDLPRRLPEFAQLGVFEVDTSFTAPAAPPEAVGSYLFRHYPRPAQGSLTGRPTVGLSLVLISPRTAAGAQPLRDWADFVHIRHIAEATVPGFGMITPYENVTGGDPRFMHFYEMDADDPEAAFQAMPPLVQTRLGGGPGTAAFDQWARHPELRIMYVNSFRLVGERTRA
jgi:hypothetical protein